jgi:hypothetical protein
VSFHSTKEIKKKICQTHRPKYLSCTKFQSSKLNDPSPVLTSQICTVAKLAVAKTSWSRYKN